MKKIKLTIAVMALAFSGSANAMPEQVPDRYYNQMWGWVFVTLGLHRPCVGKPTTWC